MRRVPWNSPRTGDHSKILSFEWTAGGRRRFGRFDRSERYRFLSFAAVPSEAVEYWHPFRIAVGCRYPGLEGMLRAGRIDPVAGELKFYFYL